MYNDLPLHTSHRCNCSSALFTYSALFTLAITSLPACSTGSGASCGWTQGCSENIWFSVKLDGKPNKSLGGLSGYGEIRPDY